MTDISDRTAAVNSAGAGIFVAVVGPSGSGKDSVMNYAREKLAGNSQFDFIRRIITRPSLRHVEDHDTLSDAEFALQMQNGAFSVSWQAHGLSYALPIEVDELITAGHVVIANVSRKILPQLQERFRQVMVVQLTAAPEVLAQRLAQRGREDEAAIMSRLQRKPHAVSSEIKQVTLDNSGSLENAGEQFTHLLQQLKRRVQSNN